MVGGKNHILQSQFRQWTLPRGRPPWFTGLMLHPLTYHWGKADDHGTIIHTGTRRMANGGAILNVLRHSTNQDSPGTMTDRLSH